MNVQARIAVTSRVKTRVTWTCSEMGRSVFPPFYADGIKNSPIFGGVSYCPNGQYSQMVKLMFGTTGSELHERCEGQQNDTSKPTANRKRIGQ